MNILEHYENTAPTTEMPPQEAAAFALLNQLGMHYTGVTHDIADTMEDCIDINAALGVELCKNLFLCNRQKTAYYLLTMPADKPFVTKTLCSQIGSARLSFASGEDMEELLGVTPGSATILGLMNDPDQRVQLLMDRATYNAPAFGCHPCKNNASIRLDTKELLRIFLPYTKHSPT
ncbi:MAG: prolyl-tRNA synthetase associated domain-containing protein, partial [Oscillospiraceae bacterium]